MSHPVPPELKGLRLYEADVILCAKWPSVYPMWQQAYPGLDIRREMAKAHAWEWTNEKKSQRARFLNAWLSRAYEKLAKEREQASSLKAVGYRPPEASGPSCKGCSGSRMVPVKAKNRWGEEYTAYAPCPSCNAKRVAT